MQKTIQTTTFHTQIALSRRINLTLFACLFLVLVENMMRGCHHKPTRTRIRARPYPLRNPRRAIKLWCHLRPKYGLTTGGFEIWKIEVRISNRICSPPRKKIKSLFHLLLCKHEQTTGKKNWRKVAIHSTPQTKQNKKDCANKWGREGGNLYLLWMRKKTATGGCRRGWWAPPPAIGGGG